MSGHTIKWTLRPGEGVRAEVTCHESQGADCRRWHDEWGLKWGDLDYCNLIEWIEGGEGWALHYVGPAAPPTDEPIKFVWDGEDWTWRYSEGDVDNLGDAYTLGYAAGAAAERELIAQAIEAKRDDIVDNAFRCGLDEAAKIARGDA